MTLSTDARKKVPTDHRAYFAAVLLFIGTFVALHVPFEPYASLVDNGFETSAVGRSVVQHGSFADPFLAGKTGPTAHLAPVFPALVAGLVRLFGDGARGSYALRLAVVFVYALQIALIPILADRLRLGYLTGILAGSALIVGGFIDANWESNYVGLILIILAFPMYAGIRSQLSTRATVFTAMLWGVALLMNPMTAVVLMAWLFFVHRAGHTSVNREIVLLLVPVLVVTPWLIRNYVTFHRPVFLRDNLGVELAISNNDCATYQLAVHAARPDCAGPKLHPNENVIEAERVRRVGEIEYNSQKLRAALSWIGSHPARFVTLSIRRFLAFWFPWDSLSTSNLIACALTLLSIPGLSKLSKTNPSASQLLLLWLVFFPPMYYLTAFVDRHRFPIMWASALPCFYFLVEALENGPGDWTGWGRRHL